MCRSKGIWGSKKALFGGSGRGPGGGFGGSGRGFLGVFGGFWGVRGAKKALFGGEHV